MNLSLITLNHFPGYEHVCKKKGDEVKGSLLYEEGSHKDIKLTL